MPRGETGTINHGRGRDHIGSAARTDAMGSVVFLPRPLGTAHRAIAIRLMPIPPMKAFRPVLSANSLAKVRRAARWQVHGKWNYRRKHCGRTRHVNLEKEPQAIRHTTQISKIHLSEKANNRRGAGEDRALSRTNSISLGSARVNPVSRNARRRSCHAFARNPRQNASHRAWGGLNLSLYF